ncbi:MAG: hypothetical protein GWP09_02050 [Nitrospiraceae bacterium]|nr:hypothetical protein [Nitrospiraceae bacterium]
MSKIAFGTKENKAFGHKGKYSTPKQRKEKANSSDFLLPGERKYPYKLNGKIDCKLVRAAITRAAQNHESTVLAHAQRIYDQHCQKK